MTKNEHLSLKKANIRRTCRIMRVLFLCLTLGIGVCFSNNSYSQSTKISLNLNNKTIKQVLTEIEKNSEFVFFYQDDIIDVNRRVSVNADNETIEDILNEILSVSDNTYFVSDRSIYIVKDELDSNINDIEQQQKKQITGVVYDALGESIIGANIIEKGTTNGTVTDIDGKFTLHVDNNAVLLVSYIGYLTQEISTADKTSFEITLQEDTQSLEELVVTGFGLAQKKATLTGTISSISSSDIERSNASTTSGALVGKIAGLNTRQVNGEPGQGTYMNIRNMGTPLFVIDGMQCDEGQFNNIDFNDIESISILKDASASIYGMRAANGVVVVTTKRGKKDTKNTVSFNGYYGWQSLSLYAKPADSKTYVTNYVQSETISGTDRTISQEDYAKWQAGTEKGYQGFDWADFIWRTAPQYYMNLNVSGGTGKTNYYVSMGRMEQEAMIRNFNGFNRTNVQTNIDMQINDRLKLGASMNGRVEQRRNPASPESNVYWIPRWSMYRNLPTKRPYANDNPLYPQYVSSYGMTNFAIYNYDQLGYSDDTWRVIQLNGDIEYKLLEGLKLKGLFGYYFTYNRNDKHEYSYSLYSYDPIADSYDEIEAKPAGSRWRGTSHSETLTSNIQLAYNKQFELHKVDAVAGFEAIKVDNPGYNMNSIPVSNVIDLIDFKSLNGFSDWRQNNASARLGWLINVNYDYSNKYLMQFSARYDGSWKFPPNHRWGFFPSGSLGWRISEEVFWQNTNLTKFIDDFKIRASYGVVGDDNVSGYGNFDYLSGYVYNSGTSGVIDGEYIVGSQARGLAVTTLSWMKAKILDVGFDAAFLGNRLIAQFDYFRRLRTGLPESRYDVSIPVEVGFSLPKENLNSDMHKGVDMAVKWSDKVGDFNYSIGGNMTYSRFYNWEQYKPRFGNSWEYYRNSAHHRIGNINWGYEAIGQFQNWEEIAVYPIDIDGQGNKTIRPGDIIYKDVNKDGVINWMDERPIGYAEGQIPSLNWGLNFSFDWKEFDLAFDLTGGALSSWSRNWEGMRPFHDGGNNPQYYMEDTWHLADIWDVNSEYLPGKYPVLIAGNNNHSNYSRHSTFWTVNTNYLKLRNIEIGYAFPKTWLSKIQLSELRLYLSGTNLITWTNTFHTDPETTNDAGLDYPGARVINIGLNVKF